MAFPALLVLKILPDEDPTSQLENTCMCFISSPEPKALRWSNSIPMTPASVVRQHFQTSSPLKLLGQLNSNFIWRLLRVRDRKFFFQMALVTWPRCRHAHIWYKPLKNLLLGTWYYHWWCGAYQVCSNDDPRLVLIYLTSRSNLLPNVFKWEVFWKVWFFENCWIQSHHNHYIC